MCVKDRDKRMQQQKKQKIIYNIKKEGRKKEKNIDINERIVYYIYRKKNN